MPWRYDNVQTFAAAKPARTAHTNIFVLFCIARYGYYFFASLGYKNTAVKKLTTRSQMIQFLAFMAQVLGSEA